VPAKAAPVVGHRGRTVGIGRNEHPQPPTRTPAPQSGVTVRADDWCSNQKREGLTSTADEAAYGTHGAGPCGTLLNAKSGQWVGEAWVPSGHGPSSPWGNPTQGSSLAKVRRVGLLSRLRVPCTSRRLKGFPRCQGFRPFSADWSPLTPTGAVTVALRRWITLWSCGGTVELVHPAGSRADTS
jgi:hypothetical protein